VQLLKEAFRAVQRNLGPLVSYIFFSAVMTFIRILTNKWIEALDKETLSPLIEHGFPFARDILVAAGYAILISIVFARMGREIDRPFWKIETDREAVRRFFKLWFILFLLNILAMDLVGKMIVASPDEGQLLAVMWLVGYSFLVLIGGSIMFYGHCRKEEIAQAMSTLLNQLPLTLLAAIVSFFFNSLVLEILRTGILPDLATPALDIIEGYGFCLVFAFTWLICMRNRDEESEDEDFDF